MKNEKIDTNWFYLLTLIMWFSFLTSQAIFLVMIYSANKSVFSFDFSKPFLTDENSTIILITGVLGIICFIISLIFLSLKNKTIAKQTSEGLQKAIIISGFTLFGCVFCEAISILGLISVFGAANQYFFIWFGLAILGIILHFPKQGNFKNSLHK